MLARSHILAALLVLFTAGRSAFAQADAGRPAPAPEMTRTQVSSNGMFGIRLLLSSAGCQTEVVKESMRAWVLDKCVATPNDLYFVSNDGERFWVLRTTPERPPAIRKTKSKSPPWLNVVVAELYDRRGELVGSKRVRELVPVYGQGQVRHLKRHFLWLEGVSGVPGRSPRVNDHNQVELETVGAAPVKLEF